jgi:hypothetical protein
LVSVAFVIFAVVIALPTLPASGTQASLVVYPGILSFVNGTPGDVAFAPVVLDGTNEQATTATEGFDVSDATGSASGWKVEATSTLFADGNADALPSDATQIISAPSSVCDAESSCVTAVSNVNFPYTLPAGNDAVATTVWNAMPGTGQGNQTIAPVFTLTLPAATVAGSYTSTWAFSLVSGP